MNNHYLAGAGAGQSIVETRRGGHYIMETEADVVTAISTGMYMKNHTWSARVEEDVNTGDYYFKLPDTLLEKMGWRVGDEIKWLDNHDGSYTMSKKNTQWVLVETVGMFRHRYLVEVPDGKAEWALDTVTMEEAKEFSQKHLGETITSHRVVTEAEAISLSDEDNEYCASWPEEKKKEIFFTSIDDVSQKDDSLQNKDVDVPTDSSE